MWDLKPGDLCVCVDDVIREEYLRPKFIYTGTLDGLTRGQIYTVRWVGVCPVDGNLIVRLDEIVRATFHDFEQGFAAARFRPVSKTNTELFHRLVAPVPTLQTMEA